MLDGTRYSIVSTDTRGTIVSFNRAAQGMLGYTPDELVGKQTPAIFHDPLEIEQHAAELSKQLGRIVKPGFEVFTAKACRGQAEEREWVYVRKDGSRFPAHLSISPLNAADGDIIGFVGIAADLSELAGSRQALIERNDSLRLLNQLSQRLHGTQELDDILGETVHAHAGLDHTPNVAIYLLNADKTRLQLAAGHGFDTAPKDLPAAVGAYENGDESAPGPGVPLLVSDLASYRHLHLEARAVLSASGA